MTIDRETDTKRPMTLGQALRHARERSGRTMGDLARFLGVSVVVVSDIERDRVPPAHLLDVPDKRAARRADEIDEAVAAGDVRLLEYSREARAGLLAGIRSGRENPRGVYLGSFAQHDDEARRQAAEAYERAAKVCDSYANEVRWRDNALGALECASRIRALTAKGGAR